MATPVELRDITAFAIKIDFVAGRGDPARPFATLAKLIQSIERFDKDLVRSIDVNIETGLVLEGVESGSIIAWLLSAIKLPSDEALKSGDPKKIVGEFLVKSRELLVGALEKADTVADSELLGRLQADLLLAAESTDVRGLPGYAPLTKSEIAAHIIDVTDSLQYLEEGDVATLENQVGTGATFNPRLNIGDAELTKLTDILAVRKLENTSQLILKVKKPDYTGRSMWEFHYEGRIIEASIGDGGFLDVFHATGSGLRPGSALRADVKVEATYDEENNSLPSKYTVVKVQEVIPPPSRTLQGSLLE